MSCWPHTTVMQHISRWTMDAGRSKFDCRVSGLTSKNWWCWGLTSKQVVWSDKWASSCLSTTDCTCTIAKLYEFHLYHPLSTWLHPVLASSYPLWQDFSKRASFPIVVLIGLMRKLLKCSKILRIRRKFEVLKNPDNWKEKSYEMILSILRDYLGLPWLYFTKF